MKFSEVVFNMQLAESAFMDSLFELGDGLDFEKLGYDHYDCSIELHGVPANSRLNEAAQKLVYDAGFSKVFMNHIDGWETHYSFGKDFNASEGWRVKYGNKQKEQDIHVYVEKFPEGWPMDWLVSGYVIVVG